MDSNEVLYFKYKTWLDECLTNSFRITENGRFLDDITQQAVLYI